MDKDEMKFDLVALAKACNSHHAADPNKKVQAAIQAYLGAVGGVIVPREPTKAIEEAHFRAHANAETVFADFADLWSAMITASQEGQGND